MSVGLGGDPNIRPGEEYESMYVTDTIVQDHSRDMATTCTPMNNVDQPCVESKLSGMLGKSQGRFSPANNCQAFAYGVVNACRTGPQMPPRLCREPANARAHRRLDPNARDGITSGVIRSN
jgi:hypothetical protein